MADPPPPPSIQEELESLRAAHTRLQLESEQSLHDLSSKLQSAESSLDQLRTTLEAANATAQEERTKREEAEKRVSELEQQRTGEGDKEKELAARVQQVEREKRELVEVLEREQRERASVEDSLTSLRALHTTLQTSHSELEATLASTTSTSRTSLLRVQTLQSTISSLEADKTFLTTELERGRSEWAAYRREKQAELSRVQSELENKESEERAAKTSLESLRKAHEGLKERHDTAISELAKVREELGTNEANFATEMGSMRRLVELMEKREEERKKRVEEVEKALEEEREALREREEELRDQLAQERERADALEVRYQETREALERGNASGAFRDGSVGVPGTPGSVASDSFALSPSAQLAARGQKTGRSYAEVYGEYIKMEEELARERAETKRLGECLAQILADIEERAPLLQEQRLEYERLSLEATQLASQLAQALTDRDVSSRHAESLRLDVDRLSTDNTILSQQLSDLGRQVRTLARVLAASENAALEGDVNDPSFDEEEAAILLRAETSGDTDSVVSAHLVTFRTINELQVQNQKLLKITRQMGAQLEKGEEDARARRRGEENKAIEEAHELVLRLKEEVESQRARTEAGEKERDMLRRMLSQRGASLPGSGGENGPGGAGGADALEATRLLADVQANFDAYKNEITIDTQRLRDDLAQAQKDANAARTELARSKAQGEFMAERFRLLTESYELQKGEMAQMSKRASEVQQTMARQDMATHKMTEDLLELRSTADQLRHENTNLKSEREVTKSVEKRLLDENAALSKERAHLSDLMRNLQTMQNELERSGNEARRRLEESVVRLEGQAAELKEKLNAAEDNNRQLALRKEIEGKTFQERLDKLTTEHSSTRESLVAAQTSQEHLEQRVRDLVLQIEAKEEKLAIFEGRSTAGAEGGEAGRTVEEQLQVTVADLRNELRSAKSELERAQAHVKQYQAIAETQGESLRQVTATYEEYKASTDAVVAEKDGEITSLRERLHSLTTDLTASNTQNSDLHRQLEAERVAFEKERKTLEDGMSSLRSADQTAREAQLAAQDDMRRQAQLAKDAHEKYERELVAHAEDVKRLTEVKDELERVRATIREHQTREEVARANLTSSEESWARQKTVLEQELADVRKRADELKEQNATLAQHLETATTQATQLQSRHAALGGEGGAPAEGDNADALEAVAASHNASVEQLREVIRYLRREKDIIDLQLDFGKQEATRLRQQLEFTSRSLEEARQALSEERQKAGDSLTSSTQHAELLESIHTAKLLRESNQTLRDENEANLRKVTSLDAQLRQANAEIDPLKEQVRTLQAEVESKEHTIRLLEEDNERWKTRNQTILAKYERIDPEELQVLKNEVEKLQKDLAAAEEQKNEMAQQIEEKTNLAESMRQNWNISGDRFKGLQVQARKTRDERNNLLKEVEELKARIASAGDQEAVAAAVAQAQADSQAALAELQARIVALEEEKAALDAHLAEQQTQQTDAFKELQEKLTAAEAEKDKIAEDRDRLAKREEPIFNDNKRLTQAVKARQAQLEARQAELEALKASVAGDNVAAIEAAVQSRLAEAAPLPPAPTDEQIAEAAKEKVAAVEAKLTAERDAAIATAVQTATAQLEKDLEAARAELATATAAPAVAGSSEEELKKAVETARKEMEVEFEKVKQTMSAESAKREKEIQERLSAEIKKLQEQGASSSLSAAPPPDVDAIVKEKVAAIEKERSAVQQQAIDKAVNEALAKQKEMNEQLLTQTKEQIEKQAAMKNNLLQKSVKGLRDKVAALQAQVAGSAPPAAAAGAPPGSQPPPAATPAPTPTAAAALAPAPAPAKVSTPTPAALPPTLPVRPTPVAANGGAQAQAPTPAIGQPATEGAGRGGAAGGRGRGGARGRGAGRGGAAGGAGRGGKAAASPPAATPAAAAQGLSLRGAAAGGRGGVLGQILGAAGLTPGAPKRARESDGDAGGAGGGGDQAKRPKGA
ncbi:hypothetical protein JCM21900_002043 [Sporobolomyces salmonicolor]